MITFKALWKSARIRSLPLSVSGIITGTAVAYKDGFFSPHIFSLALVTTLLFQILSDYANDYGDAQKGTDNQNRLGPKRALQTGEMTMEDMKKVIIVLCIMSFASSVALIYVAFSQQNLILWAVFLALAALCIVSAIKYTVGKNAYGYKGYADVMVFIFFGIVSVAGSNFLYSREFNPTILLPASAIGLLSTAVLNLNNIRDMENDKAMGKNTFASKIGFSYAKYYHYIIVLLAMVLFMAYTTIEKQYRKEAIYIVGFIPLVAHLIYVKKTTSPALLDGQLKVVALSTFLISVLFFVGKL